MSKKYCKKWQVDNFTTRWGAPSEGLSGRTSKGSVGGGKGSGGGVQGRGQNSEVRKQPVGRGQRSEVGGQGEPNSRNSLCAQRAQLQSGRAGRWRSRVRTGTATRTDTDGHGRTRTGTDAQVGAMGRNCRCARRAHWFGGERNSRLERAEVRGRRSGGTEQPEQRLRSASAATEQPFGGGTPPVPCENRNSHTDGHGRARTHKWGRWGGIVDAPLGALVRRGTEQPVGESREQRSEVRKNLNSRTAF